MCKVFTVLGKVEYNVIKTNNKWYYLKNKTNYFCYGFFNIMKIDYNLYIIIKILDIDKIDTYTRKSDIVDSLNV